MGYLRISGLGRTTMPRMTDPLILHVAVLMHSASLQCAPFENEADVEELQLDEGVRQVSAEEFECRIKRFQDLPEACQQLWKLKAQEMYANFARWSGANVEVVQSADTQ